MFVEGGDCGRREMDPCHFNELLISGVGQGWKVKEFPDGICLYLSKFCHLLSSLFTEVPV